MTNSYVTESNGYGSSPISTNTNSGYGESPAYGLEINHQGPPGYKTGPSLNAPADPYVLPPSISPYPADTAKKIAAQPPICQCQYGPPGSPGEPGDNGKGTN